MNWPHNLMLICGLPGHQTIDLRHVGVLNRQPDIVEISLYKNGCDGYIRGRIHSRKYHHAPSCVVAKHDTKIDPTALVSSTAEVDNTGALAGIKSRAPARK